MTVLGNAGERLGEWIPSWIDSNSATPPSLHCAKVVTPESLPVMVPSRSSERRFRAITAVVLQPL